MNIRVLIADDHAVVAEGLRSLIEAQADMEVVACVPDGREAVRRAILTRPDVVVMDHAMPALNGTEATRLIRESYPRTRVVMLSMYSDSVHVYRSLQAGAAGYVVKKSMGNELIEAIRTVHLGRRYLSSQLCGAEIEQLTRETHAVDPLGRLSSRERQVLQMIAEGCAVIDIASTLSLSPKTVETYRARMMDKLGIHEVAGLIKVAIQHGMISIE